MSKPSYFRAHCPHCDELTVIENGKRTTCQNCQCEIELNASDIAAESSLRHNLRLQQTKNILRLSLESNKPVDYWDKLAVQCLPAIPSSPKLLDLPAKPEFNEAEPTPPTYLEYLPEPQPAEKKYNPPGVFRKKQFTSDFDAWAYDVKQAEIENQRRYDENVKAIKRWDLRRIKHEAVLKQWREEQTKRQESVELIKAGYESLEPEAVKLYCKLVLRFSNLPDGFVRDSDLEYISETKVLIVDYALPAPDDLSRVKEVKFIQSRQEFVEVFLSEREFDEIYDDALYQTCLRNIHELFQTDAVNALDAVVFNGWVESVDRATGNDTRGCVLSVQAKKEEFQKINLSRVDPKACFKALKGIGSSTLHSLTPIAPVLKINREDKRFVASHEVAGQLDERTNLAAMDWEDFEHLIREIFEKEFSTTGGEVKVTQASRDGGVDAVVFDPDPLRGGKTIIQAKRYTNTVGVAAVRELYGTVLNEGAMKGILVTTADYGPDAYEFAKGKPLVLLNGSNLLHLLEKHGHKAKIDIKEAKRILGEK